MLRMALVAEVADVLAKARYLTLQCVPTVEASEDGLTLTVSLTREAQESVRDEQALSQLLLDLERLADTATMRALCAKYGFDAQWLEKQLTDTKEADRA